MNVFNVAIKFWLKNLKCSHTLWFIHQHRTVLKETPKLCTLKNLTAFLKNNLTKQPWYWTLEDTNSLCVCNNVNNEFIYYSTIYCCFHLNKFS